MNDAEKKSEVGGNAAQHVRAVVERIEQLHRERRELSDDLADVYREAKGAGLDVKALRVVVRLRGQDAAARRELDAVVESYMIALGMEP